MLKVVTIRSNDASGKSRLVTSPTRAVTLSPYLLMVRVRCSDHVRGGVDAGHLQVWALGCDFGELHARAGSDVQHRARWWRGERHVLADAPVYPPNSPRARKA